MSPARMAKALQAAAEAAHDTAWLDLVGGGQCLVDAEDLPRLLPLPWYTLRTARGEYVRWQAKSGGVVKHLMLHRFLLNASAGTVVDHINGNTLDNRKANLRLCTNAENCRNSVRPKSNTSGHKGVTWDKRRGCWRAYTSVNRKQIHVGRFKDFAEACAAADAARLHIHGDFAFHGVRK